MNYLKISNQGKIVAEDLMLIGSSTKREQTGKIGMFGSGWKYALAWLMRTENVPMIFSGIDQITIDTNIVLHRDTPVAVITVNGKETSLTTQMGPKWTGWMALREILSNAIDEGNHSISTAWLPDFKGSDDNTIIYVPMNNELAEVMMKFEEYFAFNRTESFSNEVGRVFIKTEESPMNIYRKGIRCYETHRKSMVDFDFIDIDINEDRLTSEGSIDRAGANLIKKGVTTQVMKALLMSTYTDWLPATVNDGIIQNLKDLIAMGHTFTTDMIQRTGGMFVSAPDSLVIPITWYKELQTLGLVPTLFELFSGSSETFIRTDAKDVAGINYFLSGFNIKVEIRSGKCNSEIFVNEGIAYVKDDTSYTDKKVAARIIQKLTEDFYMEQMS